MIVKNSGGGFMIHTAKYLRRDFSAGILFRAGMKIIKGGNSTPTDGLTAGIPTRPPRPLFQANRSLSNSPP